MTGRLRYPNRGGQPIGFGNTFWEHLVLNVAAQISTVLGIYLMYVGMLVTVPFVMTLRTSVSLERFGYGAEAEEAAAESKLNASKFSVNSACSRPRRHRRAESGTELWYVHELLRTPIERRV